MAERIWHPISKLEFFIEHTRGWVADSRESLATYEEARDKPHVLTDADVTRIKKVFTEQDESLTLFEEQSAAWGQLPDLSPSRRQKLQILNDQLAELRKIRGQVLELAEHLSAHTIDKVMAMSDMEAGLHFLAQQTKS
ncbi:hypothetical protein ACH427_16810 [Streptomyces sp. NPDC020379]|uniref:hypothetical protein n=1 Tax=Streptomyces sp. NPDC020379 TaxID=3365071 RepID=UPI003787799E